MSSFSVSCSLHREDNDSITTTSTTYYLLSARMIITLALRILQLLFGAIVLALSVVLINNHGSGHAPSQLDYGAFCGAFGIIIAVIGIGAIFIEFLQGIIIAALDALTTFLVLAAGIAFAVGAKTGSCTDDDYIISKKIFSVGVKASNNSLGDILNDLTGRCRMVQADTAFLWFLFACFLGTTILCFMGRSKGQTSFV